MKTFIGSVSLVVLLVVGTGNAFGQAPAPTIPRTADGKPDFSGVWQTGGISLTGGPRGNIVPAAGAAPAGGARGGAPGGARGAAPAGGGARGAAPAGARGAAPGGQPGGQRGAQPGALPTTPTLQAWAAEKVAKLTAKDDPTAHCYMPGVPRVFSMPMPFEIVQTPRQIVILYEAFRSYRIIPTDGRKPVMEVLPTYNGESNGRWEGDTLIVEVKNFNGKIWGPGNMKITSDALKVTERYTHNGNTVAYEATIEDSKVLTGPFVYRTTFQRPPETSVMEYECLENNIDLQHMVQ